MRADGELTRDQFGAKKAEIDKALFDIDKELKELIPKNTLPEEEEVDHEDRMKILRFALDEFVNPSDDKDIPEEIIDAFVVKIVVHPDCFDWYLRFSPDDDPLNLFLVHRFHINHHWLHKYLQRYLLSILLVVLRMTS